MEIVPHANGNGTPAAEPTPMLEDLQSLHTLLAKYPGLLQSLKPTDPRESRTVREVIDLYLQDCRNDMCPEHFKNRERTLGRFVRDFGDRCIADCTPFELKHWIYQNYPSSPWTRSSTNMHVQRPMNWAVTMRLIRENPFRGLTLANEPKQTGRDMKPEELQGVLRVSDPYFKRILIALKLTGARPAELRTLEWRHIDWQRGIAVLEKHKTSKKTNRPRVIVFPPSGMKLLAYVQRTRHGPAACELRRILENSVDGQARIKEVVRQMKALGYSYRAIYAARNLLGATFRRVGGWGEKGYTVYTLPEGAAAKEPPHGDYVFLCSKCRPWTKEALGTKFNRIRKQLGLPMSCKVYGLRHFFITQGVRRNVNLKALATLVGHQTTAMIERVYCHIEKDYDLLRMAAIQAVGQVNGSVSIWPKPEYPTDKPGPAKAVATNDTAAMPPASAGADSFVSMLIQRMVAMEEALRNPKPAPEPKEPRLQAHHHVCYEAARWAFAEQPDLATATDQEVFEWLYGQSRYHGQLPPTAISFCRYLREARRLIEGLGKREQRRLAAANRGKGGAA